MPIIPGVIPSYQCCSNKTNDNNVWCNISIRFQKIINKYENNKESTFDAGMSYALSQIIDLLVSDIAGIHLYTMNNPVVARKICEGIKNII